MGTVPIFVAWMPRKWDCPLQARPGTVPFDDPDLPARCREAGIDPDCGPGRQLIELVGQLVGFPRHLSQHTGGMVITRGPLCELVPIENAAMPERTVIQWNKDDLDELGILKVDCLALGMLTAHPQVFRPDRAARRAAAHAGRHSRRRRRTCMP